MNLSRKHIIYKISALVLVIALLSPAFVKFSHIFEDHVHNVCENPQKTHFHKFNLDCDFYSFKLKTQYKFFANDFQHVSLKEYHLIISTQYQFLGNKQIFHFFKRGPPQLI